MQEIPAKGVRWDLSDLYSSPDAPELKKDLEEARRKTLDFEKKYKPLFESASSAPRVPMGALLDDYKAIVTLLTKAGTFASLYFSTHTHDPKAGSFYQKTQETLTSIHSHLLFFSVYWNKLEQETANTLMSQPEAADDRHYLEKKRSFSPYTLDEGEEKVMALKENTGRQAFVRLFDEVLSNISFEIELGGKKQLHNESQILGLQHSPNREERKKASESLAAGLKSHARVITYIYNMVLADHRLNMQIRGYKHPMDARNLSNETDLAAVQSLVQSVKGAYPLAQRYYRLKRRLLGTRELYDYDRYAPVTEGRKRVSFEECRVIVQEAYTSFSKDAGKIAGQFFENNWIDAEVREGKRAGGFCCSTTPDLHPYILVNYLGSLRDVMTVAHELGHGLHQYLASRRVGILETSAPLTMAETASVFGEMLVFEKILERETDPATRQGLLCGKIDDNFATVFRQIALTDFELKVHEAGLSEGELTEEHLNNFWVQANAELYGDSVELTSEYRHGWKYIPHFVHSPFYCYAYAFAQLFVLALYQKYREDKEAFLPVYMEILSLGGSRKPADLARLAGLDIHEPGFWKQGLSLLEDLVAQAEAS